ncbi:MAG: hypothetical protein Q8Q08_10575 [Candidatus Omnitrophota bacterium]|nr:hypothetical protein [Candidatus Omnitrophota bacterium]MDZ4242827.1 hypothetical protein [Candidatus Omnitrophota bacterium]
MKSKLLLFLCVLGAAGCSLYHVNSEEVTFNYHPPKKSATEVVYLEAVDRPHEVVGFVTVNAERRQKMPAVIEQLKKEAGVLGGDAITNITKNGKGGTEEKTGLKKFLANGNIRTSFTATVISFQQVPQEQPAP